jgi:hypothetical protein
MVRKYLFYLTIAAFMFVSAPNARAEDQCKEVLAGGAFRTLAASRSEAFDEYLYMQALQKNYEESKKDTVAGMNIPIGSAILGANYSGNDWSNKQVEIRNTLAHNIHYSDLEQTLLSEGDSNILNAWRECIARGAGGVSVRFETGADPQGREVVFVLEYIKPASGVSAEFAVLKRSIEHSGAKVETGEWCLEASAHNPYKLLAGVPCRTKFLMASATSTITLLIESNVGSAEVSLPPRLKHVKTEPVDYPIDYTDPRVNAHFESKLNRLWRPQGTVALSADQVAHGCAFVSSTATVGDPRPELGSNVPVEDNEYCRNAKIDHVSESDMQYSYDYSNLSKSYLLACHIEPHIKFIQDAWVPKDEPRDASACLPASKQVH